MRAHGPSCGGESDAIRAAYRVQAFSQSWHVGTAARRLAAGCVVTCVVLGSMMSSASPRSGCDGNRGRSLYSHGTARLRSLHVRDVPEETITFCEISHLRFSPFLGPWPLGHPNPNM